MKKKTALSIVPQEKKASEIALASREVISAISGRAGKALTNGDYLVATDDAKMLKRIFENIEQQRKELVDPLNAVVKKINGLVKPTTDTIKMLLDLRKTDILSYEESLRRVVLAEAEKRAKKVEKNAPELAADIRQHAAELPVTASVSGISKRVSWTFEVQNLAEVPREFLVLDTSKLQKYAEAMKDNAVVTGVRFFQETTLGVSGK